MEEAHGEADEAGTVKGQRLRYGYDYVQLDRPIG
jgi:hypothetical protein